MHLEKVDFCCYGNSGLINLLIFLTFNYIQPDALECTEFKYAIDFQIGSSIKKLWWNVHMDVYDFPHYRKLCKEMEFM